MRHLIIILLLFGSARAQVVDNSNPRLWFNDHGESLTCTYYNYGAPYQQYWTWTGGTQNTCNQDPRNTITLSTTYKRAGNSSYRHYMEYRPEWDANGIGPGLQWCRNEWGMLEPGQQTLANEWRWAAISILIDPNNSVEDKRYQIGFDHKESPDNLETPFWLGIVGTRYVIQGRYVPEGPTGNGIDLGPVQTGIWVDWLLERNWKTDATGFMRFYKNGVLMWEMYGPNHTSNTSPIDRVQHGLYKWRWYTSGWQGETPTGGNPTGPHIIYTDEIKYGKPEATFADMQVGSTVGNAAPVANAGADQTFTLPAAGTTLAGSGTDADGTIVSYLWTKISGPAGGNISNANIANPNVTAFNAGTYIYQLTVTDNSGAQGVDQMQILVNSGQVPNAPPSVYAGDNKTITLPEDSVFMNSGAGGVNASDPEDGPLTYAWRIESGTGTISSPSALNTWIRGLSAGQSKFWLTVTDNAGDTATDYVFVNVNPEPVPPNPPVAIGAPIEQTVILPLDSAYINASDSYAIGDSIQTYAWTKLSGPSGGSIRSASSPATFVYALQEGTYVFRVIVTAYNTKADTADLTVIVEAAAVEPAPTITIQGDSIRYIGYPVQQVTVIADTTGNIASIVWEKISGPEGGTVATPTNDTTIINNIAIPGKYVFKVTATDTEGTTTVDYVVVWFLGETNRLLIKEGTNPARQ